MSPYQRPKAGLVVTLDLSGKRGNNEIILYVFWRNNIMHYDPVEEADWMVRLSV